MLRRPMSVLLVAAVLGLGLGAAPSETPLELGLRAFLNADYPTARLNLEAAVQAVNPSDLQADVRAGQLERLQSFETALVYLALAQFRLGGEDESRQSILRLLEAERLAPVYAKLPLQTDAAEFATLVDALVPGARLPRNASNLAWPDANDLSQPLPAVTPAISQRAAPEPPQQPARTGSNDVRDALNSLRQAAALADDGQFGEADEIYARLAASGAREVVAAAAVGLYRTGAYRDSVQAFRRLGAFGRGEEDFHYYFAVSLYESGEYEAARKELLCALPFIEITEEVTRYRVKIEQSAAQRSASRS